MTTFGVIAAANMLIYFISRNFKSTLLPRSFITLKRTCVVRIAFILLNRLNQITCHIVGWVGSSVFFQLVNFFISFFKQDSICRANRVFNSRSFVCFTIFFELKIVLPAVYIIIFKDTAFFQIFVRYGSVDFRNFVYNANKSDKGFLITDVFDRAEYNRARILLIYYNHVCLTKINF